MHVPLRLMVFTLVPLFVCAVLGATALLGVLEKTMERQLQEELKMVARALQRPVSHAIEQGHSRTIQKSLDSALEIGRVYGAYLYDTEGHLVSPSESSQVPAERSALSQSLHTRHRLGAYGQMDGRSVYSYFVPLESSARRNLGVLQIARKQSDFSQVVDSLRRDTFLALGLSFMVLSVAVVVGYYGAFGKPLRALRQAMERIRSGERGYRTRLRGPREVVLVGDTLNSMLDSIHETEQRAELERQSRLELERQLRQAEKLAALGHLSAGVAHELGTPLSVIDAHAQRALRQPLPDPLAHGLRETRDEVQRMGRIVSQLLDFGRAERKRSVRSPIDVVITTGQRAVEEEARLHDVMIESRGPRPGPVVSVNPDRIHQAIINLLKNAIQAAHGRVQVSWSSRRHWVDLTIEDDGAGFAPEHGDRLYEPFFTTKPPGEGTGLGLAIVHAVAREHGGSIAAGASELGGARFTLSLLRADAEAAPA